MEQCGAKSRDGTPCMKQAGWGTSHLGTGRCRLHGGATPIKHGLYSKYSTHKLAQTVSEMVNEPEIRDIRQQIALKQAIIVDKMNSTDDFLTIQDSEMIANISDKISRDIERLHKFEHGEKFVLQIEEVKVIVNQITVILQQEISDLQLLERIGQRLQDLKW